MRDSPNCWYLRVVCTSMLWFIFLCALHTVFRIEQYGSLQIMFVYGNMHVFGPCLGSSKLQVRHAKQIFNLTKRSCLSFMFCNSINTGHASLRSLHDIGFIGCKLNIKGVWSILDFVLHIRLSSLWSVKMDRLCYYTTTCSNQDSCPTGWRPFKLLQP